MKKRHRQQGIKFIHMLMILLLFLSTFSSALPQQIAHADEGRVSASGDYSEIDNKDSGIETERANVNKQVSFGDKPGEHIIDLTITGKDNRTIETTDVVLVYDNSNSMEYNMDGETRAKAAKDATTTFVNELFQMPNHKFRFALVTYGSSIFDGQMNQTWANNPGITANHSYKTFTNVASNITSQLPTYVPKNSQHNGKNWHGGTFTQQALVEAKNILDNQSNADNKIIVTITDGAPSLSYKNGTSNINSNIQGDGTTYTFLGGNHGTPTINTALSIQQQYEMYTIGVALGEGDSGLGVSGEVAESIIEGLSSDLNHKFMVDTVPEMVAALEKISENLQKSINNGSVEDPMGEYFQLKGADNFTAASSNDLSDGDYFLSGNQPGLTDGVNVSTDGNKIKVDGLNLGADETVTLRYKVQTKTEAEGFKTDKLYPTNGTTTLTPRGNTPGGEVDFPEPQASAKSISISGEKIWEDFGLEQNRPESIQVDLMNGESLVDTVDVVPNDDGEWTFTFDNETWYDNNGDFINYTFKEQLVDGYKEPIYEDDKIVNKLDANPAISLKKSAKSTSGLGEDVIEAGKDINYTFTIENTGNLPLKDIKFKDSLPGISDVTYETVNGDDFTGNITDLVLEPGDVLVATATYEVTQADFDYGQVENTADVEGTPTVYDEDDPNSPQKVTDEDEASVPGELDPEISLTKTASTETVSKVDEEISYDFVVKNTGNTTLTNVTLNDPMLGGEITLEDTVLQPGESTEITVDGYKVTQDDIDAGVILNTATTKGTPPPAYTNNPDNPDKVTDEDKEEVTADQDSKISLEKEADKDELIVDETIKYTFTAENTGNTTLTNVTLEDVLAGISDIEYVSVNGNPISNANDITLKPNDVLIATATYKVTQSDVDKGQVYNLATVTGIDPKEEEVTDEDDKWVPSEPELGIELDKTSDKQYVTEAGQKIEYTFTVTSTSNVTLKDVVVNDPMFEGLDIELGKTTLLPGDKTSGTVKYTVTEDDIAKGNIHNAATTTGTPPNPDDDKPTANDEVDVPVASIDLDKSSQPSIFTEAGQEITYTFEITNTGQVSLNEVTLSDDMLGGKIELEVDSLAPGDSTTVDVPYTITAEDVAAGEVLNTASTEGTPEGYDPEDPSTPEKVTDEDNDEILYAGLLIEKTSDKTEVTEAGEEITYTFEVTNNGKVTLENVEVNDPMLADLDVEIELAEKILEPGESTTGTAKYEVTQEDIDNGGVYNVATATGTPPGYDPEDPEFPDEPPVSPPSENEVPADQNADIELEKVANVDHYAKVGEEVVYTFTVTNTGNVTLNDVKVEDETFKFDVTLDKTILAPKESATGTYTHVVTQADIDAGEIENFANTEGTPPGYDPEDPNSPEKVTDKDNEKVIAKQDPGLSLAKKADKEKVVQAGEEITYTLSANNTGNTTLTDVTVTDEMLGGEFLVEPSTLAPGETGKYVGTYTVTQDDIDRKDVIKNIATATGTPPDPVDPEEPINPPVTPPVPEEVSVESNPDITLVKQADKEVLVAGETVNYTFTATNTGNVTLEKVNLTDVLEGISEIDYLTVDDEAIVDPEDITLLPNGVLVATATYQVTQADVDANELYNQATVEGTPLPKENPEDPDNPVEQDVVKDDDDAKVPSNHAPGISLEKSTQTTEVSKAEEIIQYKFVVTNTGNVTLDNVRVDDPKLDELGINIVLDKTYLVPGESTTGYADYVVTQDDIDNLESIDNIATATGTPPGDDPEEPVSPPSEAEVPVKKDPSINLIKVAEEESSYALVGDQVTYHFAATNTGNVTLTDVSVYDETFGVDIELDITELEPGRTAIGSYVHTVTQADLDVGQIHNLATAEGTPPNYDPEDPDSEKPRDEDEETVKGEQSPGLDLEKEAEEQEVSKVGDEINYTLTVTNTGNVTLTDVTVTDEMLGGDLAVDPSTLAPGESGTVTGVYTVTQADIDNKNEIVNIATATGTPPDPVDPEDPTEPPVTPPVEEEVPVKKDPSINLIKVAEEESSYASVGDQVTYHFAATNTGNVTLTDVSVYDETFGVDIELDVTELEPGRTAIGSYVHTVTQADLDAGQIYNLATVEGTPPNYDPEDPDSEKPRDEDEETVKGEQSPGLDLEKEAEEQEVSKAGDKITYHFVVTNIGNITLDNVKVDDPMLKDLGIAIDLDKTTLAPGQSAEGSAIYTVTQADIDNGHVYNVATATGTPPDPVDPEDPIDPPVSPPSEEDVPTRHDPAIEIEKTSDIERVGNVGDKITYHFVVTNTGNVTLDKVKVDDPMLADLGIAIDLNQTKLAPGESAKGSAVYTVTQADIDNGHVYNIATATGTPPGDDSENPVSPPDEVDIPTDPFADISLEKSADVDKVVKVGDKITYTFLVENTGSVTLTDIKVNDPMLKDGVQLDKTELAPGEKAFGAVTYTATEADLKQDEILNIATVTGTPAGYDPNNPDGLQKQTDRDEAVVAVEKPETIIGQVLPKTATDLFSLMFYGSLLLMLGGVLLILSRSRKYLKRTR